MLRQKVFNVLYDNDFRYFSFIKILKNKLPKLLGSDSKTIVTVVYVSYGRNFNSLNQIAYQPIIYIMKNDLQFKTLHNVK